MKLIPVALALVSLSTFACKKSDDAADRSSAKVTTEILAKAPEKPEITPIPVTTKSLEARKAFLEGREHVEKNDYLGAVAPLKKAIELDPGFSQALAYLSWVAPKDRDEFRAKAGKLAAPLPKGERLLVESIVAIGANDPARASEVVDELVTAAPHSPHALQLAAVFYAGQGQRYDKSEELIRRVIELQPEKTAAYNLLAYVHYRQGNLEPAIAAAKKQVELSPGGSNSLDTLAEMQLAAGQFADAEKNYRKAYAADTKYTESLSAAAMTQLYRKDFDGAAATLAEAAKLETEPNQSFGHALALVLMKAIGGDLKGGLAAASDLSEPAEALGWDVPSTVAMARARIHIHAGDWKAAHKEMGVAIRALKKGKSPKRRAGITQLARLMTSARVGDKAAAQKAFAALETAFKGGPAHALARAHLDWVSGDIEAALSGLEKLKGRSLNAFALDAAATILEGAARSGEAKAKRKELRGTYDRTIDATMIWLSATSSNASERGSE